MAHVLIAYSSKKGSTAGIAEAIGKELQAAGHTADVTELGAVQSLATYNAVVVGGPMYMGRLLGVGIFVKHHTADLGRVPVAGFIAGLAAVSKDPAAIASAGTALREALGPVRPVAEAVFTGKLDPEKLSFFEGWATKKAKSPVGDFRDWEAISAWARELPGKMGI
jgi:menaquinone-dependent protoporphyrinogen oxidase